MSLLKRREFWALVLLAALSGGAAVVLFPRAFDWLIGKGIAVATKVMDDTEYSGEQVFVEGAERIGAGRYRIRFRTMPESIFYCPGVRRLGPDAEGRPRLVAARAHMSDGRPAVHEIDVEVPDAAPVLIFEGRGKPARFVDLRVHLVPPPRVAHPRLRVDELVARFPPAGSPKQWLDWGGDVNSMADIARIARARGEVAKRRRLGPPVASDVIVWDLGEPAAPWLTRLGGTPYRPAEAQWPTHEGREMLFIAQWCFVDSTDLFPWKLPGDVLLLFADPADVGPGGAVPKDGSLHVEWQRLGIPVVTQKRVPPPQGAFLGPLAAHLCRHEEYPDDELRASLDGDRSAPILTTCASRIGGATNYIQGEEPEDDEVLLCTLATVWPPWDKPWPYPNREAPLTQDEANARMLMWGDCGCIYVWIRKDGRLRVEWSCS